MVKRKASKASKEREDIEQLWRFVWALSSRVAELETPVEEECTCYSRGDWLIVCPMHGWLREDRPLESQCACKCHVSPKDHKGMPCCESVNERVKPQEPDWRKRLETVEFGFEVDAEKLKSFIQSLLDKERSRVRKETIEEVKKNMKDLTQYDTDFTCPCGQEHRVSFLIKEPKTMEGKITEITINGKLLKEK